MTLIDTSSIVHLLRRKGNPQVKERVRNLLRQGDAALCDMVIVELHIGVASKADEQNVADLCELLVHLPTNDSVWAVAKQLATACRKAGAPVPGSDIIIAACAFEHRAALDYEDRHFQTLERFRV